MKLHLFIGLVTLIGSLNFGTSNALAHTTKSVSAQSSAGIAEEEIKIIAGQSACAKYSWQNRGRAPAGYVKGVALSFARTICRLKSTQSNLSSVTAAAETVDGRKDVLSYYHPLTTKLNLQTHRSGADAARAVFTIGLGLGMRESSGAYCVGWDTSAGSRRPSSAGEAGVFQTSYDSINASPVLRKLYDEYRSAPERCYLDTFKEGAQCRAQSILGTGAGAEFQAFNKSCPAFATEYAMVLLRVLRSHFGPINRRAAELRPECDAMLSDVQRVVERDPASVCAELR